MSDIPDKAEPAGRVLSVQIGLPKTIEPSASDPRGKTWVSGIFKDPVESAVAVRFDGIEGDGQADLKVHGGKDKAINAYPSEHFDHWRQALSFEFSGGAFGENLTTRGRGEANTCIGDVYRIGEVLVELSQPRQPCWKLGRKWDSKELVPQVIATGFTGWYFRVVEEGRLAAGADIVLEDRPFPELTLAMANRARYHDKANPDAAAALADCPALSESWRSVFQERVEKA